MNKRLVKYNRPNVVRGGQAVPIGNNLYYMRGRKHSQGGIDIGKDLEVEGEEVMQITPKSVKVFSAQPMFNGISPAKMVMGGINPTKVFNKQEQFKDRFHIKDDGTKAKWGKEDYIEVGKTAASFLPIVGSAMDVKEALDNPTAKNIGMAALSVGSDLLGFSAIRGLIKGIKFARKAKKAINTAQNTVNKDRKVLRNLDKSYNKAKGQMIVDNNIVDKKTYIGQYRNQAKNNLQQSERNLEDVKNNLSIEFVKNKNLNPITSLLHYGILESGNTIANFNQQFNNRKFK